MRSDVNLHRRIRRLESALSAALAHGEIDAPLSAHVLIEAALPVPPCRCDVCRTQPKEEP